MTPGAAAAVPALAGQTVLVTGATGFVGSYLAARLAELGAEVRGLARSTQKGSWPAARGIEIVVGDLTRVESLYRATRGCRFVFSIAGWVGRPNSYDAARRVSVEGTRSLVEAAIEAGAQRIVHTSSIAVYGLTAEGVVDETWPLHAVDAYGATKAQSESIVFGCSDRIETCVIRPAQVYGPRASLWTVTLVEAVKRGVPILVAGGHGTFHPCYIDNLVDAFLLAATRPEANGEAFTIVDGVTTWREFVGYYARMVSRPARSIPTWPVRFATHLAVAMSKMTGRPPPGTPESLKFLIGACRYSNEKAQRLLGWSPRIPLDEGMRRTEAWLRESGRLD